MRSRLQTILPGALLVSLLFLLQGCLIELFFAPKITAGELPTDPQMESLRSAYIAHCGRCHLLIAPRFFDREHPIDFYAGRYVAAKIMTQREADEAAGYIRILAAQPATGPTPEPIPTPPTGPTLPTPEPTIDALETPTPEPTIDAMESPALPVPEPTIDAMETPRP